jgi:hypothetical protein
MTIQLIPANGTGSAHFLSPPTAGSMLSGMTRETLQTTQTRSCSIPLALTLA